MLINNITLVLISLMLIGCGINNSKKSGSPEIGPDVVLEIAPPFKYDGDNHENGIYQRFIIKNIGDQMPSGTIVNVHFKVRCNGEIYTEFDYGFISDLMVDDSYYFALTRGFTDSNFDVSEWTVESIVDFDNKIIERCESNNYRMDLFRKYPLDPGIPDDGTNINDLYLLNDSDNPKPVYYDASVVKIRLFCRGPLVGINEIVQIHAVHYSNGVAVDVFDVYLQNSYYDMQYDGVTYAFAFLGETQDGDFIRFVVDTNNEYTEDDEVNNILDVPLIYMPPLVGNG